MAVVLLLLEWCGGRGGGERPTFADGAIVVSVVPAAVDNYLLVAMFGAAAIAPMFLLPLLFFGLLVFVLFAILLRALFLLCTLVSCCRCRLPNAGGLRLADTRREDGQPAHDAYSPRMSIALPLWGV